ncbi:MAG: hypothetical protein GF417_11365 [Candidatus Latescibacteria bacterium]|nr:hypothetical protein [bacterium]MBD3425025.1 hypothetical protein [Candidatus Latescibacterota bacterium]
MKRETIKKVQHLIMRLGEIKSCRISTDENDEITGIHVVAATERPPKVIAREVCNILNDQLDLDIDQSMIGVVVIDTVEVEKEDPPPAEIEGQDDEKAPAGRETPDESTGPPAGNASDPDPGEGKLEFLEKDVRIKFNGLNLQLNQDMVRAEVVLERNGLQASGFEEDIRKDQPYYSVIARATLDGVTKFIDEKFQLCLSGIEQVEITRREAFVASIQVVDGRNVVYLSGSAFLGRDANEASALAVLDALNRPFGRWKARKQINYRIR